MKSISTYIFWPILFLLHAAFFIYANCCGNIFLKDSTEYLSQSQNIINHGTWYCGNMNETILPQLYSQRPPLYGFFIMLLQLYSNSTIIISLVQSLLSLFNIYIALRICNLLKQETGNRKLFTIRSFSSFSVVKLRRRSEGWFLIALLFFPSQFIYANMVMPEMILQTAVMLAVYFLVDYIQNQELKTLLYYQLSITAALLIKPVFLLFPLVSLVLIILISRKNMLLKTITHIIPFVAILTISLINCEHTGYLEFSSISRKLMINYTARYAAAFNYGDAFALQQIDSIEHAADNTNSYSEKAGIIKTGAKYMIKENKGAAVFLTAKGIVNFFIDHSRYDMESFAGNIPKEDSTGWHDSYNKNGIHGIIKYFSSFNPILSTYLILSMLVNLVLFIGLIRFSYLKNIPLYYRLIIITLIFYVAILTGMTGTTRFRLPVFMLIVIANIFVWEKKYFNKKENKQPA